MKWIMKIGEMVLWNPITQSPYGVIVHWPHNGATSLDVAQAVVGLEARAAQWLIHHRDNPGNEWMFA